MIRGILLALLMVPTMATALDLKLGLMYVNEPLYNGTYSKYEYQEEFDEESTIGRIELIQRFAIEKKNAFINIFFLHMSQLTSPDPHYGINAVGAELEFHFELFD